MPKQCLYTSINIYGHKFTGNFFDLKSLYEILFSILSVDFLCEIFFLADYRRLFFPCDYSLNIFEDLYSLTK